MPVEIEWGYIISALGLVVEELIQQRSTGLPPLKWQACLIEDRWWKRNGDITIATRSWKGVDLLDVFLGADQGIATIRLSRDFWKPS